MAPDDDIRIEYCGEWSSVSPDQRFTIGRIADLSIDDNPYLHRTFLEVRHEAGMWVVSNVGTTLTATVGDSGRHFEAHLSPGGVLPLVFDETFVRFGAGPTTYELRILHADAPFNDVDQPAEPLSGSTTRAPAHLTPDQHRLVLALAEDALRSTGTGPSALPSSGHAAARLGWTERKFNKKLDGVCQKLAKAGVRGLHGGPGQLASNRRARLVEYCLSTRLVTADHLHVLDQTSTDGADLDAG